MLVVRSAQQVVPPVHPPVMPGHGRLPLLPLELPLLLPPLELPLLLPLELPLLPPLEPPLLPPLEPPLLPPLDPPLEDAVPLELPLPPSGNDELGVELPHATQTSAPAMTIATPNETGTDAREAMESSGGGGNLARQIAIVGRRSGPQNVPVAPRGVRRMSTPPAGAVSTSTNPGPNAKVARGAFDAARTDTSGGWRVRRR